jgi:small-conductance mechanosensitive channel
MQFLQNTIIAGNPLLSWIIAVAAFLGSYFVLRIVIRIVRARLQRIAKETATHIDDLVMAVLASTRWFAYFAAALYLAAFFLTISPDVQRILTAVVTVILLVQGGLWAGTAVEFLLKRYTELRSEDGADAMTLNALRFVTRLVLWSLVLLLALDNLGVDITALVTGLGVGGIAVALAVQNLLGDLFASLSIILDKPFVIGDFIIVGDMLGAVEYIGLKTTRIRSLSGEQIIFSNADLLGSRIRNFGRMYQRRVAFTIGVTYDTPREKLRRIPEMIRKAVEAQEQTRFDRSHFKEFGDFSLNFETVYYVEVADYAKYMDVQQAINLDLHEQFESEGIEFAFPTQTIYLAGQSAPSGTG